jgi:hypothetical protein
MKNFRSKPMDDAGSVRQGSMMDLAEATAVLAGLAMVLFCSGAIISSLMNKL